MLVIGTIWPSIDPYSSSILLVKKHDDTWRMSVIYKSLNKIALKDEFPILIIDEILNELIGAQLFTKLDLWSGYHQVYMHPSDIEKTTFRTHQGYYKF